METTLRPLTLGEILDRTAQLYRTHFLLLAGIASIYSSVLLVLSLIQIGVQEYFRARNLTSEMLWATIAGILIMWPIMVIAGGLAVAANNRAVAWVHLGQQATIRSSYSSMLPRLGRLLWLMVITTFMVWAPLVVLYAAYTGFAVAYLKPKGAFTPHAAAPIDPQTLVVFLGTTLVFGVLLLCALVYAILMGLRYVLAVPACVVEDLPARKAIRRSIELTKGARGRIFVLGLLVVAIEMGLVLITQVFFMYAIVKYHGQLPLGLRVLQQLVGFFTNTFVGPIYATGFTLFYYDQRVRKEGFDIEWMMRAAGLGSDESQAPGALQAATPSSPESATEASHER